MKATGLPDKIKFGHECIVVEYSSKLVYEKNRFAGTQIDSQSMAVDSTVHIEVQKEYLFSNLHWFITGHAGVDLSIQERQRLGIAMFAVLRDNPILLSSPSVDKVRIAGQDIDVTVVDYCDGNGEYDPKTQIVSINRSANRIKRTQVLFHEIYHILFSNLYLKNDDTVITERDIECITWILTMVLAENDFGWLIAEDAEVPNE